MTGLVFLHGWGYSAQAFSGWAAAFAPRPVLLLDAGYFGAPKLEIPHNADGWIGVGHSLGFAKLLSMNVTWRGLVGFGAFLRFCRQPANDTGTPTETIDAMLARLAEHPTDVLLRFARRCGDAASCTQPLLADGLERLRADLLLLRGLAVHAPEAPPPTLLVHAEDDRIVPLALAKEAQDALPASRLATLPSGGHALPFTRAEACQALLREFLLEL